MLLAGPCLAAGLKIGPLFTNHMVLQRERPVPVWGTAEPGDAVQVEFAGQKKTTRTAADGRWLVSLDSMPASLEGRELTVRSAKGNQKLSLTDVVVGDVWLGSGQSNMHFTMKRVKDAPREIAAADHPAIRFFQVGQQFAREPVPGVRGEWKRVSPETAIECSAVAYYFARDLQPRLGVPVGLLVSSVGGTRIETWMDPGSLSRIGHAGQLMEKWKNCSPADLAGLEAAYTAYQQERDTVHPKAVAEAKSKGLPLPPEPKRPAMRPHDCPGALHFGMIAPLQRFPIRGVLWYQGEANVGSPAAYEKLLPALISDWRQAWGSELPFLLVQIAPHESVSPAFRESQFRVWQATPHTGMVVTTDVGDAKDIHPVRKQPVGERLALAARAVAYGENVEYSGPVFKSMEVEGDRAVLSFTHVSGGLVAKGDSPEGFSVAGGDRKFFPARARIEGQTVVVSAPEVGKPTLVRYGFEKVPVVNLYNKDGLPAVPFRSDMAED
jgi:sialate O-acetylesterase